MDDVEYIDPETIGGVNLYAYCNNNPVMGVDPSGHLPEWAAWLISGAAIVGGIVLTVATAGIGSAIGGALIGAGAGMSSIAGSMARTVTDLNSKFALKILSGLIARGTEAAYDISSYFINRLVGAF